MSGSRRPSSVTPVTVPKERPFLFLMSNPNPTVIVKHMQVKEWGKC